MAPILPLPAARRTAGDARVRQTDRVTPSEPDFPLEAAMGKWIRTILLALLVMFAIFYLYTRPEAAAEFVKFIFGIFDSIGRFFDSLARG
ncbi:hypothetical protein H5397_04745 [Propioniciclava sp. MC1683]|uniref:hypothetical protein n=2 Tax=unclassified Propioniciclava TaxID=2642922 RepID=UPI0016033DF1|nr:hypothetical protein [Propioniciclava sp. MC1683]MBB1500746.1 hypothetical protein [Propioniciclava sp. MC1683]